MKFWDASAVVPLYVLEPSSEVIKAILVEDPSMVVWWSTRTECVSALMRQVREGNLTPADERAARHVLHALSQAWTEIQPGEALHGTAERILAVHSLRTADALQLAAANTWCQGPAAGRCVVSLDRRLSHAAYREGFTVLPGTY